MSVKIEDLRVGSVVRLASGSPKMSVTGVGTDGQVKVIWWSDRLGVLDDHFPVEVLVYPRPLAGPEPEGSSE